MSIATLLNIADPTFSWEHDQMHRTMLAAEGNSSALTAILDPITDIEVPAGSWNSDHAQAHADFATAFPAIYWPSTAPIVDINLAQGPTEFWAFQNKNLHDLSESTLALSA